jgi:hypothetical protein
VHKVRLQEVLLDPKLLVVDIMIYRIVPYAQEEEKK